MTTQTLAQKLNENVAPVRGRFSLTRSMYIAKFTEGRVDHDIIATESGVVAYKFVGGPNNDKPCAMIFVGKANKPLVHGYFMSEESRDQKIQTVINNVENNAKRNAERKMKRSIPHTFVVGDILTCSWGYDQTNIDFYEVTKLIGSTMIEICEIGAEIVSSYGTYNKLMPKKGSYVGKPMRKKVDGANESVSVYSFANAYKWDGRPEDATDAMFGR